MPRNIYAEDHEAFRASVRDFISRTMRPRAEEMVGEKTIARDMWQEAGKQGFLGLGIPQEYGGAGIDDYLFNAAWAEELSKFNAAVSSCFGIHSDVCPPYIVDLGTDEQKQRWLPAMAGRGEDLRHRDDRTLRWLRPRGAEDDRGAGRRRLDHQRFENLHHQRVSGRSGDRGNTHRPEQGRPRHHPLHGAGRHGGLHSRAQTGQGRPGGGRHGRVVLRHAAGLGRQPDRRGGHGLHRNDGAAAPGTHRSCGQQHSSRRADPAGDHRVCEGAQGVRPGDRQSAAQQVQAAEMVTRVEVTLAYVDDCLVAHAAGMLTPVDAAKAKWFSAQVQNDVLDECVQLYGGYGFMNEYRVARAWRDARVTKIWAGSNEIMKELIGRDLGL